MQINHIQYSIKETDTESVIRVYSEKGWVYIHSQFATANDVASVLGVSRTSAYRIMQTMARYDVEDYRNPDELHQFSMVKRTDLAALKRAPRGNPHFSDPAYQSNLGKRPRKKKVDK